MKIFPYKVLKTKNDILLFMNEENTMLYNFFHQHEEIQISFIKKGYGNLIVGDSFTTFTEGDILVFGKNLPHVLKSAKKCTMISIYFSKENFGKEFFDLSDLKYIDDFLNESTKGFKIRSNNEKIGKLIQELGSLVGFHRFSCFFTLLDLLNQSSKKQLCTFIYDKKSNPIEEKRMKRIMDHVMNNLDKEISLDEVSGIASMTKTAFCRYFKQRTNKTFFEFLIEIRIERACGLLTKNPDLSITAVSELCGYKNISNFNRKFKEIKLVSPKTLKNQGAYF